MQCSSFEAATSFKQKRENARRGAPSAQKLDALILRVGVNPYLPRVGWLVACRPALSFEVGVAVALVVVGVVVVVVVVVVLPVGVPLSHTPQPRACTWGSGV